MINEKTDHYKIARNVSNNFLGYQFLANLYNIIDKDKKELICIDFSECNRFDANLSAALGAILDSLSEKGIEIWITKPVSIGVRRTLTRNGFLQAFKVKTSNEDRENFIDYRKFSTSDDEDFKNYIKGELINKQKFPKHTEEAGRCIQESIYEIYTNAISHGKTSYVYSCGEYIQKGNPPTLDMTIVDCGVTIFENVNNYLLSKGEKEISSCKCLEWAMKEGNTTKNITGGLGLYLIQNFIYGNNGTLQIISHDGYMELHHGICEYKKMRYAFPGTIVNMGFNFTDKKIYYAGEADHINIENIL